MSIYSNKDTTYIQTPNTDVFGNLLVQGNLTVNGQSSTVNSTIVVVSDLAIELAKDATNANEADGGGIIVNGADARIEYRAADDRWTFNKGIETRALFIEDLTFTGTGPINIASGNDLYFYSPGRIRSRSGDFTVEASDSIDLNAIYKLSADAKIITTSSETLSLSSTATTTLTSDRTVLESNELTANIHGVANINVDISVTLSSPTIELNANTVKINGDAVPTGVLATELYVNAATLSLQSNIDAETTRATAAETTNAADVAAEASARTAAVSDEAVARAAADTTLTTDLAAEVARATAAEAALAADIAEEHAHHTAAEAALAADITAEETARIAGDSANATAITDEATTARAAEGLLTTNVATNATAISTETSRASAAETALQSNIDTKISLIDLKDIVAASTDFADFQLRIAGL